MAEFILGFTGSRNGLTPAQKDFILAVINELNPDEVHHGDCVGADALFHQIVRSIDPKIRIVIHPGNIPKLRAHCKGDEVLPAKDPLERNRDIVDGCDILLGCPEAKIEVQRSGTWSTIRYAKRTDCPVRVLGGV